MKKYLLRKSLLMILFCIFSWGHLTYATVLIKPSIGFHRLKHTNDLVNNPYLRSDTGYDPLSNPEIQFQNVIANLGIYFKFDAGLFVGATYDLALSQLSEYTYVNSYGLGVAAGYIQDGWYGSVSYMFFLSGDLRRKLTSRQNYASGLPEQNYKLSNGKGAILQVGYVKFLGSMIGIGPSIQYRFLQFNRIECTSSINCSDRGLNYSLEQLRVYHEANDFLFTLDIFFKI